MVRHLRWPESDVEIDWDKRGGQIIEAGGPLIGGIGVSRAPGGEVDDECAIAGIKAIADAIEF